jgi:hypothetical protein
MIDLGTTYLGTWLFGAGGVEARPPIRPPRIAYGTMTAAPSIESFFTASNASFA